MAERSVVLLTGASGFLGTHVARRLLLLEPACTILALVRAADDATAARRLQRAWWEWPDLAASIGSRVEVLAGDVCERHLGLHEEMFEKIARRITHIVHAAADLRLDGPLAELRTTNVQGTAHVLDVARAAHHLERLAHVSTAYVCGRRRGSIEESAFTDAYGFSTPYEQTKFEGEALVRAAQSDLPVSIFRPGMIVGDSQSGAIKTFNTFYAPLALYLHGRLPVVPTSCALQLNIVPVDYVAECIARLTFDARAEGQTVHVVAPTEGLPTVGTLLDLVREWAAHELHIRLPRPMCMPLAVGLAPPAVRALRPYLTNPRTFCRANLDRLLGAYQLEWREYLPRLLGYAVAHAFLHRADRTVYEQVLHRLAGTHGPVTYHDITTAGVRTRGAAEVRREILAAAASLRALGVRRGDRVAMVGLNSSRYVSLDVAIGLLGAVSVPLYYTSPPAEIDALVRVSRARLLLIGAPVVLARASELRCAVPMVSFAGVPGPDGVLAWEPFLALGAGCAEITPEPVGFDDLATLRFTSGTTGPPKGVRFTHGNVRWMAETMASLLPWAARTRPARYLSFLPLNHVVEGILATYSAYWLPTPVDIFFADDFRALPDALRRARPTVFFAVPRVYEKVWQSLATSLLGRLYLALPAGLWKAAARRVARRAVLRRAGFDCCMQLMVGSAAVPRGLLESFRALGIEIHNAYGLTEAPLVTINRVGANQLGSVGRPLPRTEIRIAPDGEVLVRGPQVTVGYDGPHGEQPLDAGWLLTGDLGRLTPDGSLVIEARKKEVIATSYGKKVQAARVEGLLRRIPRVTEAMLVGEARPYCTALLWTPDGIATDAIGKGVEKVNAELSHAEQIKRYAVLVNDLSIERGDLTPNLKLKRGAILARQAAAVEALYTMEAAA